MVCYVAKGFGLGDAIVWCGACGALGTRNYAVADVVWTLPTKAKGRPRKSGPSDAHGQTSSRTKAITKKRRPA